MIALTMCGIQNTLVLSHLVVSVCFAFRRVVAEPLARFTCIHSFYFTSGCNHCIRFETAVQRCAFADVISSVNACSASVLSCLIMCWTLA